jgi:hypothetical protein
MIADRGYAKAGEMATSTSVVKPGSNSATSFTRHTSFDTSSTSPREIKTYPNRNKPHRLACSPHDFECSRRVTQSAH